MTTVLSPQQNVQNKVKYKRQLRAEMMKTFGRFFASSGEKTSQMCDVFSNGGLFSSSSKEHSEPEPCYNLKLKIKKLVKQSKNCKDGFDFEFEVRKMNEKNFKTSKQLIKIDNMLSRQSGQFKTARSQKNSHKNRYDRILPSK